MGRPVGTTLHLNNDRGEEAANSSNISRPADFEDDEDLLNMEITPPPAPVMNADKTGERLIIKNIEVENFKSYYGKHSIGPFHKNFTAIIGPNGSGKSNVIDSLLFVFGFRATKMRSKKLSAMIHSSAEHDDVRYCRVAIYFCRIKEECEKVDVIPNSDFFVSRTVNKEGTGQYTLNGRVTQFKEIGQFLRTVGIDLDHNRFLILQGEVEQISLMKPKALTDQDEGMLEYLEDIIGSSRFKSPLKKLDYKLQLLKEEYAAQMLRLKLAEKEKVGMEKQVKKIVAQVCIENEYILTKTKILSTTLLNLTDKIGILEPESIQLESEKTVVTSQLEEINNRNSELRKEQKQMQKILDKKQDQLTKENTILGNIKQALLKFENDKKRSVEQQKKVQKNLEKENSKIVELEELPEKAQNCVQELMAELEVDEQIISKNSELINEKLSIVEEKTAALREEKKTYDSQTGDFLLADEMASKVVLAQEELRNFQSEEENERRKLTDLLDQVVSIETNHARLLVKNKAFEETIPHVREEIEQLNLSISNKRQQEVELKESCRELSTQVEQNRQSSEQFKSTNRLIQSLTEQKQNGHIPGIFGRLGDLGAIDEKYDVAISTTCGALDNIVVDTVETALKCINFIQSNDLGVATFIALEKQQHFRNQMENKPKTPEDVPRLFDLIRVEDPDVLPAFYYALTNTLVANNISDATRISRSGNQRWRTITLKGEVVEVSGAMTGGGNVQKRGRIGQNVKVQRQTVDINALKDELQEKQTKLADIQQNLLQLEDILEKRKSDLNHEQNQFNSTSADIKNLEISMNLIKSQVDVQIKKVDEVVADPEALKKMKENVSKLQSEQEEVCRRTDTIRMKQMQINEKIEAINEQHIGKYLRARTEAEERKARNEKQITKEKSTIALNQQNLTKAFARKRDLESDLEQIESVLVELDENIRLGDADLKNQTERVDVFAGEFREIEAELKETLERVTQLNAGELEIQKRCTELTNACKAIVEKIQVLQKLVTDTRKEIKKLRLYSFDFSDFPDHVKGPELQEYLQMLEECDQNLAVNNEPVDEELPIEMDAAVSIAEINDVEVSLDPILKTYQRDVPTFDAQAISQWDVDALNNKIEDLSSRKVKLGDLNLGALLDYLEKIRKYNAETAHLFRIAENCEKHRAFFLQLRIQRLDEFMQGFVKINGFQKEMYQMITLGGDSSLDLVDSLDPFSKGISFVVRPLKKSWKQISNLSGGEKTLASLALVFGIHMFRPTPFYVMDEIDAALDYRNVAIMAYLIKEKTKNTQFIVISLRNSMFEKADRLVGIFKVADCTNNIVLKNG